MALYEAWNTAMPSTAARAGVTTGTAIKTMLQLQTPATQKIKMRKWGVRFESAPTAIVRCEVLTTVAVAATVTAHVAAGVQPYGDANGPASALTLGTTGTGYTSTAEGTVVTTRSADEWIAPIGVSYYDYEWSLGMEWEVPVSTIVRIRMTTGTALNALCYLRWDE